MSVLTAVQRYDFRKARSAGKVSGTAERPRLSVRRSSKHIYAQLIDDDKGNTLAFASSLSPELRGKSKTGASTASAKAVGKLLADKAKAAGLSAAVFDRGGRAYHGRIKALAEGAREGGLKF